MQVRQYDVSLWGILSPRYSPALRFEAKATPGLHWNRTQAPYAWSGSPDAVASCVDRLRARGLRVKGSLEPDSEHVNLATEIPERFLRKLRDYQRAGVEFLVAQAPDGALLADDMGLGKTRQALHAIAAIGRPAIVVCPSFVRGVWQREIAKWLPKWKVVDLMGTRPKIRFGKKRRRIYLVHYDVVHAWVDRLIARTPPVETIVFDEIHFLQSDRSRRSQACKVLARHCIYRIGLSGTPMTSRPRDLWNPIDTLSEGRFGRPFDFYLRYCVPPEAPIWMGDLSFKPIGDVKPGDTVIGWDTPPIRKGARIQDGGYKRRKLIRTKVLSVGSHQAPIFKVTMASGRIVRCTEDHLWMSGMHSSKTNPWCKAKVGGKLSHVIEPPKALEPEKVGDARWLGGLFDGEGCAGRFGRRGQTVDIAQSQRVNPEVCAEMERVFKTLDLPYSIADVNRSGSAQRFYLTGGRQKALDFLTWCKPIRSWKIVDRILGSKIRTPDEIVSIEPDGFGEVVGLHTESGNYVVYGYASKNCNAHRVEVGSPNNPKTVWDVKGSSNLPELGARMKFFMLRRTKSDVSLELPPRTRQVVEVEVATRKRVAFAKAWRSDKAMRTALSVAADGKLPRAVELIGNHVETGSKVVLFAYRKAVAELIAASLRAQGINAQTVTGDVPAKKRQLIVDQQPTVLCVTMDATQVGIDFSYADVAVFVELHWVPSTLAQCEARLHRFGQKKPVLIQYIIALSTVDEIIRDAVIDKIEHFEGVVGKTDDGLRQSLDDTVLSNVEQLKKLYEKMKAQEAA